MRRLRLPLPVAARAHPLMAGPVELLEPVASLEAAALRVRAASRGPAARQSFGGTDGKTLYITSGKLLYSLDMNLPGYYY